MTADRDRFGTQLARNVPGLIGGTRLVRLTGPSERTGCDIWGKCEFENPGGSVKDRAALYIIRGAERAGTLSAGGTVVEGTAGNTGIGLATVANALGYKTVIVMPDNQSPEKMATLRALGAELVLVKPTKFADPNHFVHTARRIAEEKDNALFADQFDNPDNREAHVDGTAPEIFSQLNGQIHGFTCAAGTGGTIAGVGIGLKTRDESIRIALTDPYGAALYSWVKTGELASEGSSVAEGIGQGRVTGNLEGAPIDDAYRISDEEGVRAVQEMNARQGLCLGLSSGINIAGAEALARDLGPGKSVVTILCDSGYRYLSTLWNPEWLAEKGLPLPPGPA